MRVCIHKTTGNLIESQSGDKAGFQALEKNAISAGYKKNDLEFKIVTSAEAEALIPKPELSTKELRERRYNEMGSTQKAMREALWERVVENRPEKSDALQEIREQVKQEIPN